MSGKAYVRGFIVDMDALRKYFNAFGYNLPPLHPSDPDPEMLVGAYYAKMDRVQEMLPEGKQLEFLYWFVTSDRTATNFETYFFIPTSRAAEKTVRDRLPMVKIDKKRLKHFITTANSLLPEDKKDTCGFKRGDFKWRILPERALIPGLFPMVNVE